MHDRRSYKNRNNLKTEVLFFSTGANALTFNDVGAVVEDQGENVVDGSIGVQGVGALVVTHKAVLAAQDQHGPVDELHQE